MLSGHISAVILASGSRSRAAMLSASGLDIQIQPAELDETSVKDACRAQGKSVDFVAAQLAREKAAAISAENEDAYVIGADQMLDCDGKWFDKPPDLKAAARAVLQASLVKLADACAISATQLQPHSTLLLLTGLERRQGAFLLDAARQAGGGQGHGYDRVRLGRRI